MPELEARIRVEIICECGYSLEQSNPLLGKRQWGVIDVKPCPVCTGLGKGKSEVEDVRGKYGSVRGEHT